MVLSNGNIESIHSTPFYRSTRYFYFSFVRSISCYLFFAVFFFQSVSNVKSNANLLNSSSKWVLFMRWIHSRNFCGCCGFCLFNESRTSYSEEEEEEETQNRSNSFMLSISSCAMLFDMFSILCVSVDEFSKIGDRSDLSRSLSQNTIN